jgi:hypothetical protein
MIITDEMLGIIERNAGKVILESSTDGSVSLKVIFEPDLDAKTEDGKIFVNELKKQIHAMAVAQMEEDEDEGN